jgi:hypothetical protein
VEEGVKDRPCAVIVANTDQNGRTRVYVLPITHSPATGHDDAIEIPAPVKMRLALDGERAWVVVSEANAFAWTGPDLRIVTGKGPDSVAYGFLPPGFFRVVRDRFLVVDRKRKSTIVARTE